MIRKKRYKYTSLSNKIFILEYNFHKYNIYKIFYFNFYLKYCNIIKKYYYMKNIFRYYFYFPYYFWKKLNFFKKYVYKHIKVFYELQEEFPAFYTSKPFKDTILIKGFFWDIIKLYDNLDLILGRAPQLWWIKDYTIAIKSKKGKTITLLKSPHVHKKAWIGFNRSISYLEISIYYYPLLANRNFFIKLIDSLLSPTMELSVPTYDL